MIRPYLYIATLSFTLGTYLYVSYLRQETTALKLQLTNEKAERLLMLEECKVRVFESANKKPKYIRRENEEVNTSIGTHTITIF